MIESIQRGIEFYLFSDVCFRTETKSEVFNIFQDGRTFMTIFQEDKTDSIYCGLIGLELILLWSFYKVVQISLRQAFGE